MATHTVLLNSEQNRETAMRYIKSAPDRTVVKFTSEARTASQNNKLWSLLSYISRQKPNGLRYTPEQWKCLFMHALKHEVLYMEGLNGEAFPAGFKSSNLSKVQMSELIEFIHAWAAQHNIEI